MTLARRAVGETRLSMGAVGTSTQYGTHQLMVGPGRAQGTVTVAVTEKVTTDTRTNAGHTVSWNIQVSTATNAGITAPSRRAAVTCTWVSAVVAVLDGRPAVTMAAGAADARTRVGTIEESDVATMICV